MAIGGRIMFDNFFGSFVVLYFLTFVLAIFISIIILFITIAIHELGHLACGLLSGYKFSSFRVGSLIWYKEDGRIKFEISESFVGGQCLMEPQDNFHDFKFVLYNLGGGLFNIFIGVVALIASFYATGTLSAILYAFFIISFLIAVISLWPMKGGIPNDGYNIKTALKSEEAKYGFYLMLFMNKEMMNGKRMRDFDPEMFKIKEDADLGNYLTAYIVMMEAGRLSDLSENEAAIEQYSRINADKLPFYYKYYIKLEHLYYHIVFNPDFKKAKEFFEDKKLKKFLKYPLPANKMVEAAYEYFVNNDKEKGRKLLEQAKVEIKKYPNIGYRLMVNDSLQQLEDKMGLTEEVF